MKYFSTVFLLTLLFPIMLFAQISTKELSVLKEKLNQVQARTLNTGSDGSQKDVPLRKGTAKLPVEGSDLFYASHFVGGTYMSHSLADPSVSEVFSIGVFPLYEGTSDNHGIWWGMGNDLSSIFKINTVTKGIALFSNNVPGDNRPCTGLAFNPLDNLVYITIFAEGGTTDLYSINPVNGHIEFVRNYPYQLLGLACSNNGTLYSVDWAGGLSDLIAFTPGNPGTVLIGTINQPGIFMFSTWVSLEIDHNSNKCYLITRNDVNNHFEMNEINLLTATHALYYDFGTADPVIGFAFGNFIISKPDLNQILYPIATYDIKWIGGGAYNVKIELSINGGQSWSEIESSYPSSDNSYSWNVPQVSSNNCLVKLTNLTDPGKTTTSKQFEIRAPFQFVTGNFGDNWPSGSEQTISWYQNIDFSPIAALNKSGAPQSTPPDYIYVEISYSLNGMEGPWVSAGVVPSYNGIVNSFTVPLPGVTTDRGLFRISSVVTSPGKAAAKGSYYSFVIYSTHYFSLYQLPTNNGKLVITSPNGGESYNSGSYQTLQWRKKGIIIGSFLLEYTINNGLSWNKINTTPVSGSVSRYNWVVPSANSSKCFVRISNYITKELYDISDNSFTITPAATQSEAANYPNPFNPSTRIVFGLDKSSFTSLKVYNSIGQQVSELVNRQIEAGTHEFEFNATKLPSGVYYYNLTRDGKSEIHKMLLLK